MDQLSTTTIEPESPDCCWKCGKLGHHRQECTHYVSETQQKSISRLCKRMQRQFDISRKPVFFRKIPNLQYYPIASLETSVDIADSFYFDRIREVEEVGRPVLQPLDEIQNQRKALHLINMQVVNFNGTDRDLIITCQNRLLGEFSTDDEKENFARKVIDLEERRRDALNISNKMTMWAINAIGSATTFWAIEGQIRGWMESVNFSGRPRLDEILSQKALCTENARKFAAMQRESRNLQNICDSSHVHDMMKLLYQIKTRLGSITVRTQQLEVDFKTGEIEAEKSELLPILISQQTARYQELEIKVSCCLCQDEEKQWVLLCGHMYCSTCIQGLERTRTAEGYEIEDPFDESRTIITPTVRVPSECAFCRGTLNKKIRVYL